MPTPCSRSPLALSLLLLLTACASDPPRDGAVGLTVAYTGFRPRCLRVSAQDAAGAGAAARSVDVAGKGESSGGEVKLALYRDPSWGRSLRVRAEAFERAGCTGASAVSAEATVAVVEDAVTPFTLALSARDVDADGFVDAAGGGSDCRDDAGDVSPDAAERCDGKDNDCDGERDEGFSVGAGCSVQGCAGAWACSADGTRSCSVPAATLLYPDADGDGQGSRGSAQVPRCSGQTAGYAANDHDCNDADSSTYLGAQERCGGDNRDNDCDGQDDTAEYALGQACTGFPSATHCAGERACAANGSVTCVGTVAKVDYFVDVDADGVGAGAGAAACAPPAGRVASGNDCDDGDPFVKPGASELCDGKDNDCDAATPAELQCKPATDAWTHQDSASSDDWYSVNLFGNGGVAIAGEASQVRVQAPGASSFSPTAQACIGDWQAVWVDASSGTLYLGGETDLGVYKLGVGTCTVDNWAPGSYVRALHGLGGSDLHGVGEVRPTPTGGNALPGRSLQWSGAESTDGVVMKDHTYVLADVHGTSRAALFAVGGNATDARVYRYVQDGNGNWAWIFQDRLGNRMLRAVWVVSPTLAFAGGESNTLFRYNGSSWQSIAGPGAGDIVSLVAFGSSSVYALTFTAGATSSADTSRVFRYDGSRWTQVGATFNPGKLRDLAATRPDNLWVVGRDGIVAHWP